MLLKINEACCNGEFRIYIYDPQELNKKEGFSNGYLSRDDANKTKSLLKIIDKFLEKHP